MTEQIKEIPGVELVEEHLVSPGRPGGIYVINYKGKRIVAEVFQGCNHDEVMANIEIAKKVILSQAPGTGLSINDVREAFYDNEISDAFKNLALTLKPINRKTAVIGIDGLKKILFKTVLTFSGRKNLVIFNNYQEALDWLVVD